MRCAHSLNYSGGETKSGSFELESLRSPRQVSRQCVFLCAAVVFTPRTRRSAADTLSATFSHRRAAKQSHCVRITPAEQYIFKGAIETSWCRARAREQQGVFSWQGGCENEQPLLLARSDHIMAEFFVLMLTTPAPVHLMIKQ